MDKDKSILEKITDTMMDIANIAANAADHAMKANEAPDERSAAYIPLAADGLVSDPMMVPPIAAVHAPRRKRAASKRAVPKRAAKASSKTRPKKAVRTSAAKAARKTAARRSGSAASGRKASRKTAKKRRRGSSGSPHRR